MKKPKPLFMSDALKKYLTDILECVVFIELQVGARKNFNQYKNNELLKAAVERKLEIIGEAFGKCM